MSVTYIDPPGPLANTTEPLDFVTTSRVVSISVEYQPTFGTGLRETVWDGTNDDETNTGGDFSYQFRQSSVSGAGPFRWHIVRSTRWPADLRLRVKEAPEAVTEAALTPLDATSWGQWALNGKLASSAAVERNGRTERDMLPDASFHQAADLIAGRTAIASYVTGTNSMVGLGFQTTGLLLSPSFASGPFTMAGRFMVSGYDDASCFFSVLGPYSQARNCMFTRPGSGRSYWVEQYGSSPVSCSASMPLAPVGEWHYYSVRFSGAGQVTFGWDTHFDTVSTGAIPSTISGNIQAKFGYGQNGYGLITPAGNGRGFSGAYTDCAVWPRQLTDSELIELATIALGGIP